MWLGPVARPPTSGRHGNLAERTQDDVDRMDVVVSDIPAPERIVIDPDEAVQPAFEIVAERGVVEALAPRRAGTEHRLHAPDGPIPDLADDLRVVRNRRHLVVHEEDALPCGRAPRRLANRQHTGHV